MPILPTMDAVRTARPRSLQWDVSVDGDPVRSITVEAMNRDDARAIAARILGVHWTGLLAVAARFNGPVRPDLRLLS